MTKRQFCAGCLRTVEDYRTLVYDGARRFHFCERRDCQRQYQAGVRGGAIKADHGRGDKLQEQADRLNERWAEEDRRAEGMS